MVPRILIADDNGPVRRALRQTIESFHTCEIEEAENGAEAVTKARKSPPDLIILDLAMPEMDGLRASREISRDRPGVPIILHTLHYSSRVAVEAMKAGVRKVVPKAERATILAAIQEVLAEQTGDRASSPPIIKSPAVPEPIQVPAPLSATSAPCPESPLVDSSTTGEIAPKD